MHNSDSKLIPESFLAEIRPQWQRIADYILQRAGRKGYVCPSCGNGTGKDGDGIIEDPTHRDCLKCFKCPEYGDIFHWVMLAENCDFREAVKRCADICGLPFNDDVITIHRRKPQPPPPSFAQSQEEEPEIDLSDFFAEVQKDLEKTDYWQRRGLSLETAKHFKLGFVENWKHPKVIEREKIEKDFKAPFTPRLIIPTSNFSYLARLALLDVTDYMKKFSKQKVGKVHIFNTDALNQDICFLTEGEIDAMSVYEVGHEEGINCAALGSKSYDKLFIKHITSMTTRPKIIIICPDNDKSETVIKEVQRCTEYLKTELNKLGIFVHVANVAGDCKDSNDALINNREMFAAAIKKAKENALNEFNQNKANKIANGVNSESLIENCDFIKAVLKKAKMPEEKIIHACFSCVLNAVDGEDVVKEKVKKWLKGEYTDEKANEYIKCCKNKSVSCSYIRNELGFSECPTNDEVCSEMTAEEDSPINWITNENLINVAKLRKIKKSHNKDNIIDMLNKENCKIADKVKEAGFDKEFDKFCQKYISLAKCKKQEVLDKIDKYCGKQTMLKAGDRVGDITTKGIFKECPLDLKIPPGFDFSKNGIWNYNNKLACYDPVVPINYIHNIDSHIDRYELAIRNHKTEEWNKRIVADANTIADTRSIIKLANEGLSTNSTASKYLVQFLNGIIHYNKDVIPELVECDQPGWRNEMKEFVTPYTSDYYLGKGQGSLASILCQRGTFEEWLMFAKEAREQSYAAKICLAAGFSAPLLKILGFRTFGIYFYGTSLYGKSAACKFGASPWGDPSQMMSSFKATENGLEAAAVLSNDLVLIIDERQVANKFKDLKTIIYSLADGKTKPRMMVQKGELKNRPPKFWNIIILANGENNLVDPNTTQGAHSRIIPYHLEENERIFQDEFYAQQVHINCSKYCGTAGEIFIKKLIAEGEKNNFAAIHKVYETCLDKIVKKYNDTYLGEHLKNIALLTAGYALSTLWVFGDYNENDGEELSKSIKDSYDNIAVPMIKKLPTRDDLSDANRAWRFVVQWIGANRQHFYGGTENDKEGTPRPPANPVYGEIVPDEYIAIYPEFLKDALNDAGLPAVKVLKDFKYRGWFELEDGQYPRLRIKGIQKRMIKILNKNLTDEIAVTKKSTNI